MTPEVMAWIFFGAVVLSLVKILMWLWDVMK
jgi:hypothetical protein